MDRRIKSGDDDKTNIIRPVLRPGCVALLVFLPEDKPRGSGAPLDASVIRNPPLLTAARPSTRAACDLVQLHPRTRPAALHTQTSLRRLRAFLRRFLSPN